MSKDVKLKIVANQCHAYGNHPDIRDEEKVVAQMPPKDQQRMAKLSDAVDPKHRATARGIAEKNAMLMQIYADITGCTMQVSSSDQTCALGSALSAAVIAGEAKGGYATYAEAQAKMTGVKDVQYTPIAANSAVYDELYTLYMQVHDAFGGVNKASDLSGVMKSLIAIKERQKG